MTNTTVTDELSHTATLAYEAIAINMLGAEIVESNDLGSYAVELALRGWQVFPLRGKIPAIRGGRGVLDATNDVVTVTKWWGHDYTGCNIGARVPESMFVLDIDPRNGGADSLAALEAEHGALPETLTVVTGRGDGGRHMYFRRPAGKLSSRRLGAGVDVKTDSGYCVMPPSRHPDTWEPYRWIQRPVATPPRWLLDLMLPEVVQPILKPRTFTSYTGTSIADAFGAATSWSEILIPHRWTLVSGDGEQDGSRWRHPQATSASSATVRNGCLFVYSPNTAFAVTEAADPHGYTKFRAYAVLNHAGDLSAAARSLREVAA